MNKWQLFPYIFLRSKWNISQVFYLPSFISVFYFTLSTLFYELLDFSKCSYHRGGAAHSLSNFRVKWKPNTDRTGNIASHPQTETQNFPPSPWLRSFDMRDSKSDNSVAGSSNIKPTYLSVSSGHFQLLSPTSSSSLSIPKSSSAMTLGSFSERSPRGHMPDVGVWNLRVIRCQWKRTVIVLTETEDILERIII